MRLMTRRALAVRPYGWVLGNAFWAVFDLAEVDGVVAGVAVSRAVWPGRCCSPRHRVPSS